MALVKSSLSSGVSVPMFSIKQSNENCVPSLNRYKSNFPTAVAPTPSVVASRKARKKGKPTEFLESPESTSGKMTRPVWVTVICPSLSMSMSTVKEGVIVVCAFTSCRSENTAVVIQRDHGLGRNARTMIEEEEDDDDYGWSMCLARHQIGWCVGAGAATKDK